ncbi:MAG: RHS repeat-associated core domain-containing protein [Candidatus Contendobacter sp.]|nr:RHS repeat-associated core domain-containing protein [Candidatus Contendobacter sp.]
MVGTVGFTHDDDFRLASVSVNGAPVAYRYDADGLLTQTGALTLHRDPHNGLLTGMTLDGVSDSRTYNGFGEVIGYTVQAQGIPLLRVTYTRDLLGRITHQTETIQGGTHAIAYAYDPAGRLSEVQRNGVTTTHGYDANGNRTRINGATIATVDAQDRLLTHDDATYTHTANGELQTKTRNGQTTTYAYDVLGNLHQVILPDGKTLDYVIDGQNRRIGKKINGALRQGFLYQDGLRPVAELDGNHQIVSRFVYATGGNAPDYLIQHGQTYRLIKDHLGGPRLVLDAVSGTIAQRLDYDVWGRVLLDTNPGFQPFGFAGGLYDRDTGLVRFGARDYDPETGRWTAKDPILFAGGDANLYSYVQNDPVNWVDPWGLETTLITTYDYGIGSHSGVYTETPGKEPFLYDPAGGYNPPPPAERGSGGIFEGSEANLKSYIEYHENDGSTIELVKIPTTPEQEELIKKRAEIIGDPRGFSCAESVSAALKNICGIEGSSLPGRLKEQVQKAKCP